MYRMQSHFYKNWIIKDLLKANDCPIEKDIHLADILKEKVSEEYKEDLKNDVLWFQHEVAKGEDSYYYGKTLTHDAVRWTEETFWDKLLIFLHRKKYAKFINFTMFENTTYRHILSQYLSYMNSTNNVKCVRCNGNAELWNPLKGCPVCGNILEKQNDFKILED